jgi:hypothetical protein
MFPLHLAWDTGARFEDLGPVDVPTLPALGARRALRVAYGAQSGGYTPGDAYVLYLGDDLLPVAWAFHKGGAEAPSLVTTWEGYTSAGGLRLATRFCKADGTPFITIEDLAVTGR